MTWKTRTDWWQSRAEAAEAAVARVRLLCENWTRIDDSEPIGAALNSAGHTVLWALDGPEDDKPQDQDLHQRQEASEGPDARPSLRGVSEK